MLNPELKLNPNLFEENCDSAPTRNGYGEALVQLGETNRDVVVLTADLIESTRCEDFAKKYPDRFFDCGVAEQNMVAIASGMGISGKIPFVSSYAVFSPGKNWETIRTTVIYNQSNVKIAGHHSGIMTGPDGVTHQATEDIAITRCWPGIEVLVPCDWIEAKKATLAAVSISGPVYLRFSRDKTPTITTEETPFDKKIHMYWVSENPECTIFATGHMVYQALMAAKELEKENIQVEVANVVSIKPMDEETLLAAVKKSGAVVSVEDHQVTGGLGGALAETLAKKLPVPMEFVGLQDKFAESGKPEEIMVKYNMDKRAIFEAVKKVILRK